MRVLRFLCNGSPHAVCLILSDPDQITQNRVIASSTLCSCCSVKLNLPANGLPTACTLIAKLGDYINGAPVHSLIELAGILVPGNRRASEQGTSTNPRFICFLNGSDRGAGFGGTAHDITKPIPL